MKVNNKALFFTDLDKTLLNDKHELSKNNLHAIKQLLSRQIGVVLASGRSYKDIKENILENIIYSYLLLPLMVRRSILLKVN